MNNELRRMKPSIIRTLKKHDVVKSGVFGSYARGEQKKRSDIDILVKFRGRKSLYDLVGLKMELEEELKKKVDILTYRSVHPLLKKIILGDEVRIL